MTRGDVEEYTQARPDCRRLLAAGSSGKISPARFWARSISTPRAALAHYRHLILTIRSERTHAMAPAFTADEPFDERRDRRARFDAKARFIQCATVAAA
jgi:hypothetical protein